MADRFTTTEPPVPTSSMAERSPWLLVAGSALALVVGNGPIMQFTFGVFLKPISAEFHVARGPASLALSIGLTATALSLPIAGAFTDRYGPRRVGMGAVSLMTLCLLGLATLAHSLRAMVACFVLLGVAATGQTPLPYTKAVTARFDRKRGLALAITLLGVGVGSIVMPLIAQALVGRFGWRGGYVGLAILLFAVAMPCLRLFIPASIGQREAGRPAGAGGLPGLTVREALAARHFWLLVTGLFFGAMAANGTVAHVAPLLTDRGASPERAAGAIATVGLAAIVGRLAAGYLLDRFWAPLVALLFITGMITGMALLAFAPATETVGPAVWLIGLGLGLEADLVGYLLSRYMGLKSFGALFGWVFGAFLLASSIGPVLMGLIFDATGSYAACLTLFIGFAALSAISFLALGPYSFPAEAIDRQ